MRALISILLLLQLWGPLCRTESSIAIIGGGVGGAAVSSFLRDLLGVGAAIDVFEKGAVGGRTHATAVDGRMVELGASIIFEQNNYFRHFADELGLERMPPGGSDKEQQFSIYDGERFVFNQSSWQLVTLYRMLRRWGLSYFTFKTAPEEMLSRFLRIYDRQDAGDAFETPEALMAGVGLYDLTQRTLRDELQARLGAGSSAIRFGSELVAAINRINYGQNNSLNAFAGMVSMLPTVDDRLFALRGGNFQLAEGLLNRSAVVLRHRVTAVIRNDRGKYKLRALQEANMNPTSNMDPLPPQEVEFGQYDAVVLAAPLEQAALEFEGVQLPPLPARTFQRVVTSVVRGSLDADYFHVASVPPGEYIMVSEANHASPFSVIAPLTPYDATGLRLYKLFSPLPLMAEQLGAIFHNATLVASRDWRAYPHFLPPERFAPFRLAHGLFYNNAWENAASCMEMSIIAARNSALLAARFLNVTGGLSLHKDGAGGNSTRPMSEL